MAMIRLLRHLEAERRPKLMLDIIRASASIQDEDYEADVLVTLSKTVSLTPQAYDQILARARAMRDRPDAAATLAYLVPHAPESDRSAIFREALAAAQETKHQRGWQVRFLFLIAVHRRGETS